MKKLLPFLVVVALLALLLVMTVTVSAGSKGNGGGKGNAADKHNATDKGNAKGPDKEVICHLPGTPNQKTMEMPAAGVLGHLQHGDSLGPCVEEPLLTPSPSPTVTVTPVPTATATPIPTATFKVTICHKPGTPAEKTLALPRVAIPGHLRHGDDLGPCLEVPLPTPSPSPTATVPTVTVTPVPTATATPLPTETVKVTICHKPGTRAEKTLHVDATSTADHLGHGDYLGVCGEAPPEFAAWLMPSYWWYYPRR